jgi:hypothetical protein
VIGFYFKKKRRRKLFQESFENAFEIIEKEKEKELISQFGPKPALFLSFRPSCILFPPGRGPRRWAGPASSSRRVSLPFL